MEERRRAWLAVLVFAVLLGLGIAGALFFLREWLARGESGDTAIAEGADRAAAAAADADFGESGEGAFPRTSPAGPPGDADVRAMLARLSDDAALLDWLRAEGLLDRFAAVVEVVSRGESPRELLSFLAPAGRFTTVERNGREFLDPESYHRYDSLARAFDSLDTSRTIRLIRELEPWLARAHRAVAPAGRSFRRALGEAFAQLLAVPVVEGDVALVRKEVILHFADPALESLTDAEKHVLRMGPENVRRIQAKLSALAAGLGLEAAFRRQARD